MKKLWYSLSRLGVHEPMTMLDKKQIILSNQLAFMGGGINVFALPLAFMAEPLDITGIIICSYIIVITGLVMLLNALNRTVMARILLSVLPYFFTFLPLLAGYVNPGLRLAAYFYLLTAVTLPLILLSQAKYKFYRLGLVFFYLATQLLLSPIFNFLRPDVPLPLTQVEEVFPYLGNTAVFSLLTIWLALSFLFRINNRFEGELQEANEALQMQREEIAAQNEELQVQNEQLSYTLEKLQDTQGQLIQSEKMAALGQLTAGIAHELNNPINYINSGLTGMQDAMDSIKKVITMYQELDFSEGDTAVQLERIKSFKKQVRFDRMLSMLYKVPENMEVGANRAAELVRELRTFSRLDEADLKNANLHEGLECTLVLLRNQYKNEVEMLTNYDGTLPMVECYPGKLNQVFMNLITNAIQAIKTKDPEHNEAKANGMLGQVKISTQYFADAQQVTITIEDNGIGIPTEIQHRIFEPFFTTKPVGQGTGLGLSIASSIVEDHHGTLSLDSKPGKGSTFTISLPIHQPIHKDQANHVLIG